VDVFTTTSQSGTDQPNHIIGLLMWLDASEAGTLSRSGTDAKKMYDKAPGGHSLVAAVNSSKPKILQSRFNGKTVLRFERPPQFLIGHRRRFTDNIISIGVINGVVQTYCTECMALCGSTITIPAPGYVGPVELAELLVYDAATFGENELKWVQQHLSTKWQVKSPIVLKEPE